MIFVSLFLLRATSVFSITEIFVCSGISRNLKLCIEWKGQFGIYHIQMGDFCVREKSECQMCVRF